MIEKKPLSKVNPEYSRRHQPMSKVDRESIKPKYNPPMPADTSLDASHRSMREVLSRQVSMIHAEAMKGGLSTTGIETLGKLANTWRILTSREPDSDINEKVERELDAMSLAQLRDDVSSMAEGSRKAEMVAMIKAKYG